MQISDRTPILQEIATKQHTISVNVDIDALGFYHGIHGLGPLTSSVPDPVWSFGVPRFLDLFAELGLSATFFIVASDLVSAVDGGSVTNLEELEQRRELVHTMIAQGHEVASHSFSHDYALSRFSSQEIRADLKRANEVLTEVAGQSAPGFRAPGYNLSPALIDAVQASGATYSSSRLPSPPYFLAKWLVMLKGVLMGQPSQSIVGETVAPFFARRPYRHRNGLLELPMSVIPWLRLPAIGTFFTLYGDRGPRWLLPFLEPESWLNLEFHGIDLLDASDAGVGKDLLSRQPDLPTSVRQKSSLFRTWLGNLAENRRSLTLLEVANNFDSRTHDLSRV